MRLQLLKATDYPRTPWRNGLGYTDQIAIHPPTADLRKGDFAWRISTPRIEKNSPFSPFPHLDRFLVVLEGAGLRLTHEHAPGETEAMELPPLEPYEFPGDVPTRCELLDGPVRDLSVFIAKGRVAALSDRLRIPAGESRDWQAEGLTQFAFVARGAVRCRGELAQAGECFRLDYERGDQPAPLELTAVEDGEAQLILISLSYGT